MARGKTITLKNEVEVTGLDKLDKLGKKLDKVGKTLTLGVTAPLLAAGTAAFKFASDLNEATSKAATVFGDAVDTIDAEATRLDDAFSESKFRDTAGTFGALLKNMGFTEQAAADLSVEWLNLAEDMASFHNTNVDDALGAIQSAISGEFEPLKRFGVRLNETTIKAEAAAKGLDATDAQVRALIVSQELFAQQPDVLGDYARTAEGAANRTKNIAANFEDALARLGKKLLPLGTRMLELVNTAVTFFAELDDGTQTAILLFAGFAAALGPVLGLLGNMVRVVSALGDAFAWAKAGGIATSVGNIVTSLGGLVALAAPLGIVAGALLAIQQAFSFLGDEFKTGNKTIDDAVDALGDFLDGSDKTVDGIDDVSDALKSSQDNWQTYQDVVSASVEGTHTAILDGLVGGTETAITTMQELIANSDNPLDLLGDQFKQQDAIDRLTEAIETSLSPAQQAFEAQGFLASDAYKQGINSGDPFVRETAADLARQAEAAIARNSLYDAGRTFSYSFGYGMKDPAVIEFVKQSAYRVTLAARGIFPSSEPKDPNSPLRGITDAFGMMDVLAAGIDKHDDVVPNALRNALRVPRELEAPRITGPRVDTGGGDPLTPGAVAGLTVNVNVAGNLAASEDTLPGTISRGLFAAGISEDYLP